MPLQRVYCDYYMQLQLAAASIQGESAPGGVTCSHVVTSQGTKRKRQKQQEGCIPSALRADFTLADPVATMSNAKLEIQSVTCRRCLQDVHENIKRSHMFDT